MILFKYPNSCHNTEIIQPSSCVEFVRYKCLNEIKSTVLKKKKLNRVAKIRKCNSADINY